MIDETMIVTASFITFVALVYRPIARLVTNGLDNRAVRIEKELDEAIRLREEAQAVLASYQKKQRECLREAEQLLKDTKKDAERLAEKAQADLKDALEKRVKLADEKIAQAEAKAVEELQHHVVDIATSAARAIIMEQADSELGEELIKMAVSDIERKLH
jgi:F-type H+-transporting ATPase subunit b